MKRALTLLLAFCFLIADRPLAGYSVLSHEEVIDLAWKSDILPALLKRFPNATPEELKRRIPGGHIRLRFADPQRVDAAIGLLGLASRDHDALTLRVPSDGSLRSLKTLIGQLDDGAIDVDELSVHTPDLDDVFLALTGNSANEKVATR